MAAKQQPRHRRHSMTQGIIAVFLLAGFAGFSVLRLSIPTEFTIASEEFQRIETKMETRYARINNETKLRYRDIDRNKNATQPIAKQEPPTSEVETLPAVVKPKQEEKQDTKKKKLPKFYAVHIGPSKTGTSAIQKNMAKNPFEENTFAQDNIIFLGKRSGQSWPDPNNKNIIRTNPNNNKNKLPQEVLPRDEIQAHSHARDCMESMLMDYYHHVETNSNDSNDKIIASIETGSMFQPFVEVNHTKKYIINLYNNLEEEQLKVSNERLENDEATRTALAKQFRNRCWTITVNRKKEDYSYMLDYSLITSQEELSYSTGRPNSEMGGYKTEVGLRFRIFDILGYERLVLVGAYRRYADWVVSVYTQRAKQNCLFQTLEWIRPHQACQSAFSFIQSLLRRKNDLKYGSKTYGPLSLTLPFIRNQSPSNLEVKVLNFFQLNHTYHSITTEFYCEALGKELAPATCEHALEEEAAMTRKKSLEATSDFVANKGTTSDAIYQMIAAAGHRLKYILPDEEIRKGFDWAKQKCLNSPRKREKWCEQTHTCSSDCQGEQSLWDQEHNYVTFNGTYPIIGTANSTIRNYKELSHHHHVVHQKNWVQSLPLLCPTDQELEPILERSLEYESIMFPEFAKSPLGDEEHKRLFWDDWVTEKKLYCTVDILRLFRNATSWDEIINDRMVNYDWSEDGKMTRIV